MKAMILTAGLGTRLRPLTLERAKPAVPLLGKPLIIRLIEKLTEAGIGPFRLNLHHLPSTIESVFDIPLSNNLQVSFSYEQEILGTAGGLKSNESFFDDETFVMVNGDIVMEFPLKEALAFHHGRGAIATLLLVPQSAPYAYYPVQIDEDHRLWNFKNTGACGTPREGAYVFTGVHIIEPEIFDFIPSGRFCEINDEVYPAALRSGKDICGFPVEGYWNDLGNPRRYLEAQKDLLNMGNVSSRVHIGSEAVVQDGAEVGPYVSLENGCVVESGSTVQDSVVWENSRVTSGAVVLNSILGSGVTIHDDCRNKIVTSQGEAIIEAS